MEGFAEVAPKAVSPRAEFSRLLRFALVGGGATATYVGMAYLLVTFIHLGAIFAAVTAHATSTLVSYFGHQRITFEQSASHAYAAPRFAVLALSTFSVNIVSTWLLADLLHAPKLSVIIITNIAIIATGYVMARVWVFARKS